MNEATKARICARRAELAAEVATAHGLRVDRALASWQNLAMASAFARGLGDERPLSEVFAAVGLLAVPE
jgi:hypothetical protein